MNNWRLVAFDKHFIRLEKKSIFKGTPITDIATAYNHPTMWDYYNLDKLDRLSIMKALKVGQIQENDTKAIIKDAIKYLEER